MIDDDDVDEDDDDGYDDDEDGDDDEEHGSGVACQVSAEPLMELQT